MNGAGFRWRWCQPWKDDGTGGDKGSRGRVVGGGVEWRGGVRRREMVEVSGQGKRMVGGSRWIGSRSVNRDVSC